MTRNLNSPQLKKDLEWVMYMFLDLIGRSVTSNRTGCEGSLVLPQPEERKGDMSYTNQDGLMDSPAGRLPDMRHEVVHPTMASVTAVPTRQPESYLHQFF